MATQTESSICGRCLQAGHEEQSCRKPRICLYCRKPGLLVEVCRKRIDDLGIIQAHHPIGKIMNQIKVNTPISSHLSQYDKRRITREIQELLRASVIDAGYVNNHDLKLVQQILQLRPTP